MKRVNKKINTQERPKLLETNSKTDAETAAIYTTCIRHITPTMPNKANIEDPPRLKRLRI